MATDRLTMEALYLQCEAARVVYVRASQVIEDRLRTNSSPTSEEWAAEEEARHGLAAARRALADAVIAPSGRPSKL
jgi:hypothetical protein